MTGGLEWLLTDPNAPSSYSEVFCPSHEGPRPNDPPRLPPCDQAPPRPTFPAASAEATRRSCKPNPTPGVRRGSVGPSGWKRDDTQGGSGQTAEAHDHYLSPRRRYLSAAAVEAAETPNTATSGARRSGCDRSFPTEGSGSGLAGHAQCAHAGRARRHLAGRRSAEPGPEPRFALWFLRSCALLNWMPTGAGLDTARRCGPSQAFLVLVVVCVKSLQ